MGCVSSRLVVCWSRFCSRSRHTSRNVSVPNIEDAQIPSNSVLNTTNNNNNSFDNYQYIYAPELPPNVFNVTVDSARVYLGPERSGQLIVSDTDLSFCRRHSQTLTWPLKYLRRFGLDRNLFTFESGRKCVTGAGIFGFRCDRAPSLHNMIQEITHRTSERDYEAPIVRPITKAAVVGAAASSNIMTPATPNTIRANSSEIGSFRLIRPKNITTTPSRTRSLSTSNTLDGGGGISIDDDDEYPGTSTSLPYAPTNPIRYHSSPQTHPLYVNVNIQGDPLFATCNPANFNTNLPPNPPSPPPPPVPRRRSTGSEKGRNETQRPQQEVLSSSSSSSASQSAPASGSGEGGASQEAESRKPDKKEHAPPPPLVPPPVIEKYATVGNKVFQPSIKQVPADVHYTELHFTSPLRKPSTSSSTCSQNSASTTSTALDNNERYCLYNKRHRLLSSYIKQAEPYKPSKRISSVGDDDKIDEAYDNNPPQQLTSSASSSIRRSRPSSTKDAAPVRGYATIDFDKTAQLNKNTRSKITLFHNQDSNDEEDDGSKKSRSSAFVKSFKKRTTGLRKIFASK